MNWYMKFMHKSAKYLLSTGFYFWVIETLYFLYRYGWHTKAINEAEKICDTISSVMMVTGIILYAVIVLRFIDEIFEEHK